MLNKTWCSLDVKFRFPKHEVKNMEIFEIHENEFYIENKGVTKIQ